MNFVASNGTVFIIRREDNVDAIAERLKALLTSRPDAGNGSYEYIDLRIDSKIFLKNKEI
jgi:hypothetical protein